MSALHVPVHSGPIPVECVIVDTDEGLVNLDVTRVTDADARYVTMTPAEARALATALWHYAAEAQS